MLLALKLLLTSKLAVPAMVVTQLKSTSGLTMLVLFTHHANNTLLKTWLNALLFQLINAVIALVHLLLKEMKVLITVLPSHLIRHITSLTTITSRVLTK